MWSVGINGKKVDRTVKVTRARYETGSIRDITFTYHVHEQIIYTFPELQELHTFANEIPGAFLPLSIPG